MSIENDYGKVLFHLDNLIAEMELFRRNHMSSEMIEADRDHITDFLKTAEIKMKYNEKS